MSRTRYTVNDKGLLVDRHGYEFGRITGIVIDFSTEGFLAMYELGLRAALAERAGDKCERCPTTERLEMHHRTYERLGHELLEDVELLCRDCHQAEHDRLEALGTPLVRPSSVGDIGGLRVNGLTTTTKEGGVGETIDVPVHRRLGEDGQPVPLLSAAGEIEAVWQHYVEVMEPRNKQIDPAARALIRDALKVATRVECKRAIDGCKASAFHMGENDRGKKYNRLSQILKGKRGIRTTREQIDLFLDIAEKRGVASSVASVDPARLAEAKRNVLTAWEMPGSRQAKELGEMSAAWLAQHGYRIEYADGGRPQFIEEGA